MRATMKIVAILASIIISAAVAVSVDNDTYIWEPTEKASTVSIEVETGYSIAANITTCNFPERSYAVIAAEDYKTDTLKELLFTYTIQNKPVFVFKTEKIDATFYGDAANQFVVEFSRTGELITTTEAPTTTDNGLPNPGEADEYSVHIRGKSADHYRESANLMRLKKSIAGMALEYCTLEKFPLNGTISERNVMIHWLVECPHNWPGYETCIKLIFSVPINLNESADSPWTGYQLTREHLEIMWQRYANKYLKDDDDSVFPEPDVNQIVKYWAIGISLAILIFLAGLYVLRWTARLNSNLIGQKNLDMDEQEIIPNMENNNDFNNHYTQEIPSFFDTYDNNAYAEPYTGPLKYFNEEPSPPPPQLSLHKQMELEESGA